MIDSKQSYIPISLIIDYKPDPVSYHCQWSGDWSPIPGCAIEVDISYSGTNLNQADAKGADRQKDAHACQALCRSRNNTYFKWVSPEFNHTLDPSAVPFSCFCKNDITARKIKPGSISGAATRCGVDCNSPSPSSYCRDASKYFVVILCCTSFLGMVNN